MKNKKQNITLMQYIFLIHGTQVGIGVLTLPRELAEKSGTDGWIALIIAWLFSTIASLIIIQIMKKYPNGTILNLLTHYFGKWLGRVGTILFALYFALLFHVVIMRGVLFTQALILPQAQLFSLMLLLAVPSYLIARRNITVLGRYSELVFFMTIWLFMFFLVPLQQAQWVHLLPVVKEGWVPILHSIQTAIFSFIGFEIAFFLYPFLQKKEKASIGIVIANTLSMLLFLLITIVAFVFISPDGITTYSEPTIVLLKVLEFSFIERIEIVFLSFYLFLISTTFLPFLYITVFCTSQLVGKQDPSRHLVWLLIIELVYVLLFPPTFDKNNFLQQIIQQGSLIFGYAFPLCLWSYLWVNGLFKGRAIK